MNVELLRKIAAVIQEKPAEFNMQSFHEKAEEEWSEEFELRDAEENKWISCTTTHCIAGWAQLLSPERDISKDAEGDAARLLELSREQSDRLFFGFNWPKGFSGSLASPQEAAARIEHFIATGGAE
jgi:hypothetical protein